ncbi:MAG TPA: energy transducer TonB [Terriglobales bacterium]|nr:energy transducer TonB [Terriglobales bacterium]
MSAATIYDHQESWKGPIAASAILHGALFLGAVLTGMLGAGHGESWGGSTAGESAMNATLVSAAVPLPATNAEKENVLANESKGLAESTPAEKTPEPEAIPIPDKTTKLKPEKLPRTPTTEKTKTPPPPSNQVPFGQGGPVSGAYTMFKSTTGTGGMTFGPAGSFGSRYSWYVDTVRRKVSENWLKYEVDPSIGSASRVYLTFDIQRDGTPTNIQISQGSGVPSLDMSAKRALQRIDTFGPLPPDYAGSRVSVEFWFDYKK